MPTQDPHAQIGTRLYQKPSDIRYPDPIAVTTDSGGSGNTALKVIPIQQTLQDSSLFASIIDEKTIEIYDLNGGNLISTYTFDIHISKISTSLLSGNLTVSTLNGNTEVYNLGQPTPEFSHNEEYELDMTGYTFEVSSGGKCILIINGSEMLTIT